jgi:hypothetical protein
MKMAKPCERDIDVALKLINSDPDSVVVSNQSGRMKLYRHLGDGRWAEIAPDGSFAIEYQGCGWCRLMTRTTSISVRRATVSERAEIIMSERGAAS